MKKVSCFLLILLSHSYLKSQTTEEYKSYLIQWEGYKNTVYLCPSGHKTIGIGHNLEANKERTVNRYISEGQIDAYFRSDFKIAYETAKKHIVNFKYLPKEVKLTVISVIWTVGPTNFAKFKKFIKALNEEKFKIAAKELDDSKWKTQVGWRRAKNHIETLNKY